MDFLIDGMLSGTGVRDAVNGGYVDPRLIGLSEALAGDIADWQQKYEQAHFAGFPHESIAMLDEEGTALADRAASELSNVSFGYFSNGAMKRLA